MDVAKELLMKEQRVLYWDRFGIVLPDMFLQKIISEGLVSEQR